MPRFGATTFPTDYGLSVVDLARAVEERGLDSIFFNEHTHIPVSRRTAFPGGGELPKECSHTHDLFLALAAATVVSKRIMLSTGICLVIERDPIVLAKEVASLDRISDGRVILGVGAEWNVAEMENHGTPYSSVGKSCVNGYSPCARSGPRTLLSFTASSSTLNRSGPGQSRSKSPVRRSFLDRGATML
jgi:alkanesulfonate monooxygenase SsuD/methylene tetrahydromethanopterin reductase-like flavin-dependent oxidoreductase (luciferase family)